MGFTSRSCCAVLALLLLVFAITDHATACQEWVDGADPWSGRTLVVAGLAGLNEFHAVENGPGFILVVGRDYDPYVASPFYLVALENAYPVGALYPTLGHLRVDMAAEVVRTYDNFAYLAAGGAEMLVVDVSDPSAMSIVNTLTLGGACRDMVVDFGRELLITAEWDAVRIYSVADPAAPLLVGAVPAMQSVALARLPNELLLVAGSNQGLRVIDTTNPAIPVQVAQLPLGGSVRDVAVWSDRALLTGPTVGLVEVDITNPLQPQHLRTLACSGEAEQVGVSAGHAYVRSERVEPSGSSYLDDLHLFRLTHTHGPLHEGTFFHRDLGMFEAVGDRFLFLVNGSYQGGLRTAQLQCAPVSDVPDAMSGLELGTPFPNPFNPSVTVTVLLPQGRAGNLAVHDTRGRLVRRLWQGTGGEAARRISWDGRNDDGQQAPSGTYLFVLTDTETGERQTKRASLLK